jgi:CRP/FNR family nitrogen fixation transcriptional regulator
MSFLRDQEIFGEGEAATYIYQVQAGVVRTCKFLHDGRRQVNAFFGIGGVFGFQAGPSYGIRAAAACDCAVTAFRRLNLETIDAAGDRLSLQLFSLALDGLVRDQEHALSLGRRSAIEKLAAFLLGYTGNFSGSDVVDLPMTRRDIADYLGLTIETVSRGFTRLQDEAFIQLMGSHRVQLCDIIRLRTLCA